MSIVLPRHLTCKMSARRISHMPQSRQHGLEDTPIKRSGGVVVEVDDGHADYLFNLFGGGRTSVGAARRCGLPALCSAFGL